MPATRDSRRDSARDQQYMRRALELARRGWGQTAPNPMVGAVIVQNDVVVGEGYHERYGEAHAEVNALRQAGQAARGATMYVTLEPCAHMGKTPPCSTAVIEAGIARIVIATSDPNPEAAGGAQALRAAGISVELGVLEDEARELNAPFFFSVHADRPWVTLKLAMSLDGAIADASRSKGWLSNEQSRAEVQRMRANADAIAVGVDTAIIDDPALTVRIDPPPRISPLRVIFDRSGRLPQDRTVVRTADEVPTLIMREPNLQAALRTLHERGIRSLLVEGGAGLAAAFFQAGLVDRLVIFQAPLILGQGALQGLSGAPAASIQSAVRYPVVDRRVLGEDVMTTYAIHAAV